MPKSRDPLLIRYGMGFVLIVLLLVSLMMALTGGMLNSSEKASLYVGIAIITGVSFWVLTPGSTGQVKAEELGLKLGGAAAIGAAFMLLAWWLTTSKVSNAVLAIPTAIPKEYKLSNLSPDRITDLGEVRTISGGRFWFVNFSRSKESGLIKVEYLKSDASDIQEQVYTVTLEGEVTQQKK